MHLNFISQQLDYKNYLCYVKWRYFKQHMNYEVTLNHFFMGTSTNVMSHETGRFIPRSGVHKTKNFIPQNIAGYFVSDSMLADAKRNASDSESFWLIGFHVATIIHCS